MTIRPYNSDTDFDIIKNWTSNGREHALWCAGRTGYPLEREGFDRMLDETASRNGDKPYIAEAGGEPAGFFCLSVNGETKEGMLKFVIVSPERRGKGYGREMISLAAGYAFDAEGAIAVCLNVFSVNEAARKCYKSAGFVEQSLTENAFVYNGESWGRVRMIMKKNSI